MNQQPDAVSVTPEQRPLVFYDGACPLCSREIAHYRRIDRAQRLRWVDAATEAKVLAAHGLDPERAMAELHVLDGNGGWHRGVDAFLVIWSRLPAYRWLARLVSALGLRTPLVLLQGDIDGFRATQMIQDKAQSAGNGRPFSRTATPYWIIWVAPFGRAGKRSSAVLRLLARVDHSRRGAPCGQPLPDSLNPSISP